MSNNYYDFSSQLFDNELSIITKSLIKCTTTKCKINELKCRIGRRYIIK